MRTCVWWVPDFSIDRDLGTLLELDDLIRSRGALVAYSTRHLLEAQRLADRTGEPGRAGDPAGVLLGRVRRGMATDRVVPGAVSRRVG